MADDITTVELITDSAVRLIKNSGLFMTPQGHIDEFKRFARAHMRWISFEFDRIVSDIIANDRKKHDATRIHKPND